METFVGRRYSGYGRADEFSYEDAVFVDCMFENCAQAGAEIAAVFVGCKFINQDWYWCCAYKPIFIDCSFEGCDLRGSFYEAAFVRCRFEKCMVGKDNLGGNTTWEGAVATDCTLVDTEPLPITKADGD